MKTVNAKDPRVETARGLAVLLMVAGHVIGYSPDEGLRAPQGSDLRLFYDTLQFIRLPLFTVISGYVYARRPAQPGALWPFMRGKLRRLLLPLLSVGGVFYVLQASVPGVNDAPPMHEAWRLVVFPYAHFWYLQSLLVVFAVTACVDAFGGMRSPMRYLSALTVATLLPYSPLFKIEVLSLEGSAYLMPFFVWGIGLARYRAQLCSPRVLWTFGALAIVAIGLRQLALLGQLNLATRAISSVTMVSAFASTLVVLYLCPAIRPLARIGHYAYTIYLMHVFGTAATRIALERLDIANLWIHFSLALGIGVAVPIAAERVLDRIQPARLLFLGRSTHAPANLAVHPYRHTS